ncbi:MAG: hypothetical protein FWG94_04065 [Oscillospiraceae bacterium]|nr:hypothetical protein [Oscillospiraceae bacterium]
MQADTVDYAKGETPMTDYQFKRYEELRDKCFALECKNEALYQTVKASVEVGKTPEEILESIAEFKAKHL